MPMWILRRLVERKLIVPEAVAGRQRPYRISAAGAQSLEKQLREMRRIAGAGLRRLENT
jgi:DNA-binding PadR family transcriptional regulator